MFTQQGGRLQLKQCSTSLLPNSRASLTPNIPKQTIYRQQAQCSATTDPSTSTTPPDPPSEQIDPAQPKEDPKEPADNPQNDKEQNNQIENAVQAVDAVIEQDFQELNEPYFLSDGKPSNDVWELDFCSRPLVDEAGKKVWEVLVCDPSLNFVFSKYLPSKKINSGELKKALQDIVEQTGAQPPDSIKYFRSQMNNIITKAVQDFGSQPVPSRRCFAIIDLLNQRTQSTYPTDPRFNARKKTLFQYDPQPPQTPPPQLKGKTWFYSQLPFARVKQEMELVASGDVWGAFLPDRLLKGMKDDTIIPGLAVVSDRAEALAAWTHAMELAFLTTDIEVGEVLMETDANKSWRYAPFTLSPDSVQVATAWEAAKERCNGLHFLVVQSTDDPENCTGFWLMIERPLPEV